LNSLLDIIAGDCEERFTYVARLAAQFNQNRRLVYRVLDLWLDYWRDLLLIKAGCDYAITNADMLVTLVDQARGYSLVQIKSVINSIQAAAGQLRQNANPRLVLEVLMLSIPRRGR